MIAIMKDAEQKLTVWLQVIYRDIFIPLLPLSFNLVLGVSVLHLGSDRDLMEVPKGVQDFPSHFNKKKISLVFLHPTMASHGEDRLKVLINASLNLMKGKD